MAKAIRRTVEAHDTKSLLDFVKQGIPAYLFVQDITKNPYDPTGKCVLYGNKVSYLNEEDFNTIERFLVKYKVSG